MTTAPNSRWPALLCAFFLFLCALATFPVAEIGMTDDWSYVQSARVLAQTGHIVYNGWTTAMLGWQLFLGALFVKLFGPSFTAIRASTLLVAVLTAFLIERTFRRAGLGSRNAAFGTLALVLSPIFLPYAVSFMTEIAGLFCVVLCLYACLRALQAKTDRGCSRKLAQRGAEARLAARSAACPREI
jgi:4-amino-4-deoxy-L-arabinose transferase-like glycosyltransferase